MPQGSYKVYGNHDNHPGEIYFAPAGSGDIAPEQLALQLKISRAETVMRQVTDPSSARFHGYQKELLAIAQAGLVGPAAQPEAALANLLSLQDSAVAEFGSTIKNRYMDRLRRACSIAAITYLAIAAALWLANERIGSPLPAFYAVVEAAAMLGVFVSFGFRTPSLSFTELQNPEGDFVSPANRLTMTSIATLIVCLFFQLQLVTVTVGPFSTDKAFSTLDAAALVGFLCGFSETRLPSSVNVIAERFTSLRAVPAGAGPSSERS